jgi:hypothetical protein
VVLFPSRDCFQVAASSMLIVLRLSCPDKDYWPPRVPHPILFPLRSIWLPQMPIIRAVGFKLFQFEAFKLIAFVGHC